MKRIPKALVEYTTALRQKVEYTTHVEIPPDVLFDAAAEQIESLAPALFPEGDGGVPEPAWNAITTLRDLARALRIVAAGQKVN